MSDTSAPEPQFTHISHDDLVADVQAIARQIEAEGWRPDFVVGVGRGGLVPGTYLSHRTGIALLSIDHSSRLAHFSDDLLADLARRSAGGERILFIDDINDTGGTIERLRAAISRAGGTLDNVRFAVLIDNVRSAARVHYRSRIIDRAADKSWYVFPWEALAPRGTLVDEAFEVPERLA